jgi:hypothetical protein
MTDGETGPPWRLASLAMSAKANYIAVTQAETQERESRESTDNHDQNGSLPIQS